MAGIECALVEQIYLAQQRVTQSYLIYSSLPLTNYRTKVFHHFQLMPAAVGYEPLTLGLLLVFPSAASPITTVENVFSKYHLMTGQAGLVP